MLESAPEGEGQMTGFLIHWLILAIALFVTTRLVGGVRVDSYATLAVAALVIGFVNALVKPVLVILSLPLTILTLGLFYLVVNGACLMLAAALVPGFTVSSWGAAIIGALVLSVIGWLVSAAVGPPAARS
jgi:putative membrane protein